MDDMTPRKESDTCLLQIEVRYCEGSREGFGEHDGRLFRVTPVAEKRPTGGGSERTQEIIKNWIKTALWLEKAQRDVPEARTRREGEFWPFTNPEGKSEVRTKENGKSRHVINCKDRAQAEFFAQMFQQANK